MQQSLQKFSFHQNLNALFPPLKKRGRNSQSQLFAGKQKVL